jgi:hypothetical protein
LKYLNIYLLLTFMVIYFCKGNMRPRFILIKENTQKEGFKQWNAIKNS